MARKILVIDDDRTVVEIVKKALTDRQYEVYTAKDGKEGLDQVRNCHPDLIVLDVMMPTMDGYEFIRALRALKIIEREPMVPVIVITAKEDMEQVFRFEGVKEYMIKPIETAQLVRKVGQCLGTHE